MTRTSSTALIAVGLIAAVGASIGALVAKEAADRQASIDQFAASFDNRLIDFSPDYTAMWILIVVAALGAVALIAGVAARPRNAEEPPTV